MSILDFLSQLFEQNCSLQEKIDLLENSLRFIESPKEIVQAVHYIYKLHGINKDHFTSGMDIVGTGGDHRGLFNLSTTASFVIAGSGIPVLKNGNTSVSSRSGSIDCLKALSIKLPSTEEEARQQLDTVGLTFLFAQNFYPYLASIKEARLELAKQKQRTLFNFIGPLLNPLNPTHQLIGVAESSMVKPMADALFLLNRSGFVFCCQQTDELIPGEDMHVLRVTKEGVSPASLSRMRERAGVRAEDLLGGDPKNNADILLSIVNGSDKSAKTDVTLFNAAFAIMLYNNVEFDEAFEIAKQSIQQTNTLKKLLLLQGASS